ncbi:NAD-binding protein [Viridibacterium curvum]|uniref:RCK N-terminal domain-containing protein n=1 Tax=Viridibacterium curvum TaxID=1101404 RepID=A0ABP9QFP9_9RHOO
MPPRSVIVSMFLRLMAVARYRFIMELLLIFMVVWCGCAILVFAFESGVNRRIDSPLSALYFLLVSMMTSGDSAVAPLTTGGRLIMSIVVVASKLLTALLCALAAAVLIERKMKEEMGLKMHKLQHHIVIIGWNLKGAQIIKTLRAESAHQDRPILVVADTDQKPYDDPLTHFTRSPVPIRKDTIERTCLGEARSIVLLANYAERQNADALTAVSCLLARQANPDAQIIAELLDPSQRLYLEAAGANVIVGIGEVGGFLLGEAVIGNQTARQLLDYVASKPASAKQSAA